MSSKMINRKGSFWRAQTPAAQGELIGFCIKHARNASDLDRGAARYLAGVDRGAVRRKVDAYYADTDEHLFGGTNGDDPITDPCDDAAAELANDKLKRHEDAIAASVQPEHFRATAQRVRRYFRVEGQSDALRSVSCAADRSSCSVRYKESVGDLGKLGDIIFGEYNRDYEAQLTHTATSLYKRLFADKRFQRATLTMLLDVRTVGGKAKVVPALVMTCDREANAQIDWDAVEPRGLRTYCAYALSNIEGL